jgi:hypothetical protein
LNTYRVWLIYELFRGEVTAEELEWSERQIRDFVLNRKSTNPHLCEALAICEAAGTGDPYRICAMKLILDVRLSVFSRTSASLGFGEI